MKNRSYDLDNTEVLSERFTPLSNWGNMPKHLMLRMFGNLSIDYDKDHSLRPIDLEKIEVGDKVYFGNSDGVVTELILSEEEIDLGTEVLPEGSVIGIRLQRNLNYLNPLDRMELGRTGYNSSGTGVDMSYMFYQNEVLDGKYKNGGGSEYLYPGSFYVSRRYGVGSYPSVYESIKDYQSKF